MIDESIRIQDRYYILATSARIDNRTRVLKHGDTFGVFDRFGDLDDIGLHECGLYHHDTRFLSRLVMRMNAQRPLLLDSTTKEDNTLFTVDLMNPDLKPGTEEFVARGQLHVFRSKLVWRGGLHERVRIRHYGNNPVTLDISVEFGADFADLFEVRGLPRVHRGRLLSPQIEDGTLVLAYQGLDGVLRCTRITTQPAAKWRPNSKALFHFEISPHAEVSAEWTVSCEETNEAAETSTAAAFSFDAASAGLTAELEAAREQEPQIVSSNERFNRWIQRSFADILLLRSETPYGAYPYAGVPWYSTPFGRDGIITAMQCLWVNPQLALDVLRFLAAMQATETDPARDAQPGKILHETRACEMAALREIPFGRYYGSIDATPLFIMLAAQYVEWTGDLASAAMLWPHVALALEWIDKYGDPDGDGFYEYARQSRDGLLHQGWKDSQDSVFHADGRLADGPIALCEVQAYVFAAKRAAAGIAALLGMTERSCALLREASELQTRFESAFWSDELSTYVLALDGTKAPCRVIASNAGHCLFAGIASEEHARRTAATLTGGGCYSGWGIRTVGLLESRYNPMSYHNGSVWPHDNAIIAAGLARYGMKELCVKVMTGLFDAASISDMNRLPELFCGFTRRPKEAPTLYPVACSPQAWAAGAAFMCLQASLGLHWQHDTRTLTFTDPMLPSGLMPLRIGNLRLGDSSVELRINRGDGGAVIDVESSGGSVNVVNLT